MSLPTRPVRYIARPASVVIRTVGEDAIAWNKADGTKLRLTPASATLLASVPSQWVNVDDVAEPKPGTIQQLISAGLLVERTAAPTKAPARGPSAEIDTQ